MRQTPAGAAPPKALRAALMFLSGFAGLGYQIVWTRQGTLWLGHDMPAVLAVVAAFFGGLALGALTLGARLERSARPALGYAACEVLIAAWAMVLLVLGDDAAAALAAATGATPAPGWQWTVAFAGTFLLLLPATAAMGATLPALAAMNRHRGSFAGLYAANTAGAVAGVLASAFALLPTWGLARTVVLCAGLNAACAALAWWLARHETAAPAPPVPLQVRTDRATPWRLAFTGLLGIGCEVVTVRALSQVTENTVFTFALILAVYLVGTSLGAAWHARVRSRLATADTTDPADRRERALLGLALACACGAASLAWAPELKQVAVQVWQAAGANAFSGALLAEATLALFSLGAPSFAMGAVFAHLCEDARAGGLPLGRALAWNTAGAALAPLLFGAALVPVAGLGVAAGSIVLGYAALAMPLRGAASRPGAWTKWVAAVGLGCAGAAVLPSLRIVEVPAGGRLLSHRSGIGADVAVVEDAAGVRWLHIDNRQPEGSSATMLADGRQALLPLLLHGAPGRALFLGVGSGVTSANAARWPGLQVDAVELLPEVLQATPHFLPADAVRPHYVVADARRFVRAGRPSYDVIVADNFHPARSGSGSLYTVEHFRAVRARLATGGLFCQWLPLHQMDLDTLRSVVRSFVVVFPEARALLSTLSLQTPVLGLVGSTTAVPLDPVRLQAALDRARQGPGPLGLAAPIDVLGQFVAGPSALARWTDGAVLNTDDHPVVTYRAPRATYAPAEAPAERLLALLGLLQVAPDELLGPAVEPGLAARLQRYRQARDHFLQAGLGVRPTSDPAAMLAQVRVSLLEALSFSPEFRPAAEPLQRLAAALEASRPIDAERLRTELAEVAGTAPGP